MTASRTAIFRQSDVRIRISRRRICRSPFELGPGKAASHMVLKRETLKLANFCGSELQFVQCNFAVISTKIRTINKIIQGSIAALWKVLVTALGTDLRVHCIDYVN